MVSSQAAAVHGLTVGAAFAAFALHGAAQSDPARREALKLQLRQIIQAAKT